MKIEQWYFIVSKATLCNKKPHVTQCNARSRRNYIAKGVATRYVATENKQTNFARESCHIYENFLRDQNIVHFVRRYQIFDWMCIFREIKNCAVINMNSFNFSLKWWIRYIRVCIGGGGKRDNTTFYPIYEFISIFFFICPPFKVPHETTAKLQPHR